MDFSYEAMKHRAEEVTRLFSKLHEATKASFLFGESLTEFKKLGKNAQIGLLERFYDGFPNGREVAGLMHRIINIPWMSAESLTKDTTELAKKYWNEHLAALKPYHDGEMIHDYEHWIEIKCNYSDFNDRIDTITKSKIYAPFDIVSSIAGTVLLKEMKKIDNSPFKEDIFWAIRDVESIAAHPIEKVINPLKLNPFEPLMKIYELGLIIYNVNDQPALGCKGEDRVPLEFSSLSSLF